MESDDEHFYRDLICSYCLGLLRLPIYETKNSFKFI